MDEYGVFSAIVATAGALVLTFSAMIVNMIGRARKWTWMVAEQSPDIPMLGAKVAGIVILAATYLKAKPSNADWFLGLAAAFAIVAVVAIVRFNGLRKLHVLLIPVVGADGTQQRDARGRLVFEPKLIGKEHDMLKRAKKHFEAAKKERKALTFSGFIAGYGPYDAEAIWGREYLARLENRFMTLLMTIFLSVSVPLFMVALVIVQHVGRA